MFTPDVQPYAVRLEVLSHAPGTPNQPSALVLPAKLNQEQKDDLDMPKVPQKTSERPRTQGQLEGVTGSTVLNSPQRRTRSLLCSALWLFCARKKPESSLCLLSPCPLIPWVPPVVAPSGVKRQEGTRSQQPSCLRLRTRLREPRASDSYQPHWAPESQLPLQEHWTPEQAL